MAGLCAAGSSASAKFVYIMRPGSRRAGTQAIFVEILKLIEGHFHGTDVNGETSISKLNSILSSLIED
jgi:hypothetical protein